MKKDDLLIEIHTEELPPKSLLKIAQAFRAQIKLRLEKASLNFQKIDYFATPRRLALLIQNLDYEQPMLETERRGPAVQLAFDQQGNPTKACQKFAESCGVSPDQLIRLRNEQNEWVGYRQKIPGKNIAELLPSIIEEATKALPFLKKMYWGEGETQFVRPVHSVILLYGEDVIKAKILGVETNRVTRGHRFLAPDWITIPHASAYVSLLETEGLVIADFEKRREAIHSLCVKNVAKIKDAKLLLNADLLDEVTGLVESPQGYVGSFDGKFLKLPAPVLISAMENHQRYFPVLNGQDQLLPYFILISNINPHDPSRLIRGNERVLRARLADAEFFYLMDQKESLEIRVDRLRGMVFKAKLGTLYDRAQRLSRLSAFIAKEIHANEKEAERAGLLAKTDLTTDLVNEFPELQGVMGFYYAQLAGEKADVAIALKEQYLPRFAGDSLPLNPIGQSLALADRIDLLAGTFAIEQLPTGDKDPYGLRRAAIGIVRILIENKINLDLKKLFAIALEGYQAQFAKSFAEIKQRSMVQLLYFMQERMRAFYQEQGIPADVFAAVAALNIANPLDIAERIKAVQAFKKLNEAESLAVANKRVSNILSKYTDVISAKTINPELLEEPEEQELAKQLELKSTAIAKLYQTNKYDQVLLQLAELRSPIDNFFDHVMVMTENKSQRENRILLLAKLRTLFLQVADIALLQ